MQLQQQHTLAVSMLFALGFTAISGAQPPELTPPSLIPATPIPPTAQVAPPRTPSKGGEVDLAVEAPAEPAPAEPAPAEPAPALSAPAESALDGAATPEGAAAARNSAQDAPMPGSGPDGPLEAVAAPRPNSLMMGGVDVGFAPIGSLSANNEIGSTDIDVEAKDRPKMAMPEHAPVLYASSPAPANWHPDPTSLTGLSWHQPLFFEDPNLERYGASYGLAQPVVSACRGLNQVQALPFNLVAHPPRMAQQVRHPFEAGRYGYRERNLPPRNAAAAVTQAGVTVGLIFLVP